MKILCGIDGGDYSLGAARVACDLAKRLGAELTICMANPLVPGRGPPIYLWPEEHIARVLADARRKATWSGVRGVKIETWRTICVSDSIADYADQQEIDYIVIGASDRTWIVRMLSGSVSRELAQKANCPVLIVHRVRGEPPARGRRGFRLRDLLTERVQYRFESSG